MNYNIEKELVHIRSKMYGTHFEQDRIIISDAIALIQNLKCTAATPIIQCKNCRSFKEYTKEYAESEKVDGTDGTCFMRAIRTDDIQFYSRKFTDFCSDGKERKD